MLAGLTLSSLLHLPLGSFTALSPPPARPCCARPIPASRPTFPARYHTACLTPQQRHRSPTERRWACPQCSRRALLGRAIDGILAVRGGGAAREYRIKWAGRSHLHCEWVKEVELQEAATLYPGLQRRLKHFNAKRAQQAQQVGTPAGGWGRSPCGKSECLQVGSACTAHRKAAAGGRRGRLDATSCFPTPQDDELVDGVKPSWLEVERVIAERPAGGSSAAAAAAGGASAAAAAGSQLLCKWRELPYSECTWEDEADIPEAQPLIQQFRRRRPIGEVDLDAELRLLARSEEAGEGGQPDQQQFDEQQPDRQEQEQEQRQQRVQDVGQPADAGQEGGSQQPRRFPTSPYFLRGQLHPYQVRGPAAIC